jgi:hypothetical protein
VDLVNEEHGALGVLAESVVSARESPRARLSRHSSRPRGSRSRNRRSSRGSAPASSSRCRPDPTGSWRSVLPPRRNGVAGRSGPRGDLGRRVSSNVRGSQEISEWRDLFQALGDGVVEERRNSRTFRSDVDASSRITFGETPLGAPGHQIGARLRLGIGDDLANVLLAREDRHESVDAEGEAGVRWRAIFEGPEQEPESALGFFFGDPQGAKDARLDVGAVNSNGSAAQFPAVQTPGRRPANGPSVDRSR